MTCLKQAKPDPDRFLKSFEQTLRLIADWRAAGLDTVSVPRRGRRSTLPIVPYPSPATLTLYEKFGFAHDYYNLLAPANECIVSLARALREGSAVAPYQTWTSESRSYTNQS